jgi:hypothetical protein
MRRLDFNFDIGLPTFRAGGDRTRILSAIWAYRLPSVLASIDASQGQGCIPVSPQTY